MKIAVVTPYYDVPADWLRQCIDSVAAQTIPCTHIVVADGKPQDLVDAYPVQHVRLPVRHNDFGNTPRGLGSVSAISQGFDAIAYLDADNWFSPEHLETMLEASVAADDCDVVASARNLRRLDGSLLSRCQEVDGEIFVDTNCYFLRRPAFNLVVVWWSIPADLRWVGDRILWRQVVQQGFRHTFTGEATVQYRTAYRTHYEAVGETAPEGFKDAPELTQHLSREDVEKLKSAREGSGS